MNKWVLIEIGARAERATDTDRNSTRAGVIAEKLLL